MKFQFPIALYQCNQTSCILFHHYRSPISVNMFTENESQLCSQVSQWWNVFVAMQGEPENESNWVLSIPIPPHRTAGSQLLRLQKQFRDELAKFLQYSATSSFIKFLRMGSSSMRLVANFDSSSEWILYTFLCTFSKALNCSPGMGLLDLQILHATTV